MRILGIILLMTFGVQLFAQSDSLILSQKQFKEILENYHPIAIKANLLSTKGKQEVRKARGGFDPKVQSDYQIKEYKGYEYFNNLNAALKVPTWFGVELKAGIDRNQGEYLNPQNSVPDGGLVFAGISVPVGKNLILDKRRAVLKQAKIYAESTEAERAIIMNDLYFEATKMYWYWVQAWNDLKIHELSVTIADMRFRAIKTSFEFGDKPAIDTLEAFIQLQSRQVNRNQALLDFTNRSLDLSNYLWAENIVPLELADGVHPPRTEMHDDLNEVTAVEYAALIQNVSEEHPALQLYNFKQKDLEVEQTLKKQNLLPTINLKYNALNEPVGNNPFTEYDSDNYKFGFEFEFPLFLRKETGSLKLNQIKIQELELTRQEKLLSIQNKLNSYFNFHENLQDQVALNLSIVSNYEDLLSGEKQKFESGESSLFLINSREKNLFKAQLKLNSMTAKYHIANAGVYWAAGVLYKH